MRLLYVVASLFCLAAALPSPINGTSQVVDGVVPRTEHVSRLKIIAHRGPRRRTVQRSVPLINADHGRDFLVPVTFGTQTLDLLLDTGSSQTWVFAQGFGCAPGFPCRHGTEFAMDTTFRKLANMYFDTRYADNTHVTGIAGYEKVVVAGVTVSNQIVGAVETVSPPSSLLPTSRFKSIRAAGMAMSLSRESLGLDIQATLAFIKTPIQAQYYRGASLTRLS